MITHFGPYLSQRKLPCLVCLSILSIVASLLAQSSTLSATTYFFSGFETGDVSAWLAENGGNHTGGGYITTEKSHSGTFCWKAYNNPNLPYPDNISAKLLRWRFDYNEAYYSAWYFWPADYIVSGEGGQYVNIFQWKERASPWDPTWVVAVKNSYQYPGEDEIVLHDFHGAKIIRNGVKLPKGRWFRLEAFLKTGRTYGQIIVWLDGQQIFSMSNINTSGNPSNTTGYLMWGVGNYGDAGIGKYIYVDDAVVADHRVLISPPIGLRVVDH